MAVLIEAISVVVRRSSIETRFSGGWGEFLNRVPNNTLRTDEDLARLGFMSPPDVEAFIRRLELGGLTFLHDGKALDIAVVDQMQGPTIKVEWLEFAHISLIGTENKVAACWLFEGPRIAAGVHMPAKEMMLATPDGWTYENSLSAKYKYIPNEDIQENIKW
ncbi:MAG TPA: hypothetical protein PKO27_13000 [Deltaproteobacteria bacterium]|nr:hypothetical protein [Deltaproteobacteria bacterium]HPA07650.1 hypothetical protein [Methanoregulaceae archaeon]